MPREPFREQTGEDHLVELYRRVGRLEEGMVQAEDGSWVPRGFYDPTPPNPKTLIGSKPGRLRDGIRATPFGHPEGAAILTIRFELDVAGSTSTTLLFEKNGDEVTPIATTGGTIERNGRLSSGFRFPGVGVIPADVKVATVYFEGLRLAPEIDSFVMAVDEAGAGAFGLTSLVTFAR